MPTQPRKIGKGLDEPCDVCGERRFTERAHFPRPKRLGQWGKDTILLCPTHHRLLDNGRLSKSEFDKIRRRRYAGRFNSVEDLIDWAHSNGFDDSIEDLKRKFWNHGRTL